MGSFQVLKDKLKRKRNKAESKRMEIKIPLKEGRTHSHQILLSRHTSLFLFIENGFDRIRDLSVAILFSIHPLGQWKYTKSEYKDLLQLTPPCPKAA